MGVYAPIYPRRHALATNATVAVDSNDATARTQGLEAAFILALRARVALRWMESRLERPQAGGYCAPTAAAAAAAGIEVVDNVAGDQRLSRGGAKRHDQPCA